MLFKTKNARVLGILLSSVLIFSACAQDTINESTGDKESQVPAAEEQTQTEDITPESETKDDQALKYISASKLNVRETPHSTASIQDSLIKGSKVKILSEKQDEAGQLWYEVEYKTFDGNKTGHISAEYTVDTREELLGENLRGLDFSPFEKIEYKDNKKVLVKGIYVTVHSAAGAK